MSEHLSENEKDDLNDLARILVNSISRDGVAKGYLNLDGLTPEEAKIKAFDYALDLSSKDGGITHSVTIHTDTLLDEARSYLKDKKIELAIVLYGTWWEHWLNGVIEHRVIKQGLDENDYKDIVRSLNNRAKTSWLFKLLDLPLLDSEQLKTMSSLSEKRNQFIHYKYPATEWENDKKTPIEFFEVLESSIKYFENYEEINVYSSFSLKS
jgi:hypothetical protein